MNRNIDDITKDLLKDSMERIPDENFSDRLMERITEVANEEKKIFSNISLSWIMLITSMILMPVALPFIVRKLNLFSVLNTSFQISDPGSLTIIYSLILGISILFILNNLLKLTFGSED